MISIIFNFWGENMIKGKRLFKKRGENGKWVKQKNMDVYFSVTNLYGLEKIF